jgi:hypothetical protein
MAQIFHRSTNTLARLSIFGAVFIIGALALVSRQIGRSSYATGVDDVRVQPIQFSHNHHVAGIGIDCCYCHTSVEDAPSAGMPPTKTCMNCHAQVWADSPYLEPVRASFRDNKPIHWQRVYDLPDFVYFDHSIHVRTGVECSTCHGQVQQMPLMRQESTLLMEWCLDCHRQPARYVRLTRPVDSPAKLTNCSVCHR